MTRSAVRRRASPVPDSSQMTTVLAPISMSESSPNPPSATDRAATAAKASTTTPTTFQPRVIPSRMKPRRRSRRCWSAATAPVASSGNVSPGG